MNFIQEAERFDLRIGPRQEDLIESLRVCPNGDIFIMGQLATNDPELAMILPHSNTDLWIETASKEKHGGKVYFSDKDGNEVVSFWGSKMFVGGEGTADHAKVLAALRRWAKLQSMGSPP